MKAYEKVIEELHGEMSEASIPYRSGAAAALSAVYGKDSTDVMADLKEPRTEEDCASWANVFAAARFYLTRHGFEIVEEDDVDDKASVHFIAKDGDGFHFVRVVAAFGTMVFPRMAQSDRDGLEREAIKYFACTDQEGNSEVHFDELSIAVAGEHRALIRFARDAFSGRF